MTTTGQTITDRLNAGWYALAGQGLARVVCKATTEEVLGPKKKHLSYLVACTEEPNVSIPQLANLIIERTHNTSWVVVFKALISVHHLMIFGNERFTQYLASSNYSFELSGFLDRTAGLGYNMSTFVRKYSKYINQKVLSYRLLAIDLCKIKQGKDGYFSKMHFEELIKTLPTLQSQFDCLLEFECGTNDLTNGVIDSCFHLMFRDLNRLYGGYHDAMINLLERYFKLSRRNCREALAMYKKFLASMEKAADFFKIAETIGIEKVNTHDMKPYTSLLTPLENHLQTLEAKSGKKGAVHVAQDAQLSSGTPKAETAPQKTPSPQKEIPKKEVPKKPENEHPVSAPAAKEPSKEKKVPPVKPEPPRPPRPASPKKNREQSSATKSPANAANPFLADSKVNHANIEENSRKKTTFANTFGDKQEDHGSYSNVDTVQEGQTFDVSHEGARKTKPPRPTSSPLVSPTRNMKLEEKITNDGRKSEDGQSDERSSRPPSRPPPPSSGSSSRTVSPTAGATATNNTGRTKADDDVDDDASPAGDDSQTDEKVCEPVVEEPDDETENNNSNDNITEVDHTDGDTGAGKPNEVTEDARGD
ncbi:Phosphatidylinositol-binding clathrin assembly protein LAP [Fragariocoptes setiger]|uniref:Phosphatidylinositol-binding clathrin assembly protein LAP n=1 Tax=Fragariocoptes setiger TaxID=1670756 RepID=A0ABQ7SC40_9ACAR|nr:Phosphatidylinositol-binding clathrin assembly protein LAP [Fragariocoptes setiger]